MESVNQVPDVESGLSDSTGTSEHLVPDDVNLPSQYKVMILQTWKIQLLLS